MRNAMTLPHRSAAPEGSVPGTPADDIHRKPMRVDAQVTPLSAATRFPRRGCGAVAEVASVPTRSRANPLPSTAMNSTSRRRVGSPSNHGARSEIYKGAVDCRKMVLAAVVSLVPRTKRMRVAA
jgi:hypothetical protein